MPVDVSWLALESSHYLWVGWMEHGVHKPHNCEISHLIKWCPLTRTRRLFQLWRGYKNQVFNVRENMCMCLNDMTCSNIHNLHKTKRLHKVKLLEYFWQKLREFMHRTIDLSNSMRPLHRNSMLASETIQKHGQKLLPKLRLSLGNKLFIHQFPLCS